VADVTHLLGLTNESSVCKFTLVAWLQSQYYI